MEPDFFFLRVIQGDLFVRETFGRSGTSEAKGFARTTRAPQPSIEAGPVSWGRLLYLFEALISAAGPRDKGRVVDNFLQADCNWRPENSRKARGSPWSQDGNLTSPDKSLPYMAMLQSDTIVADAVEHIPEDEDTTLRQNAPEAHRLPKDTSGDKSWVFFGKHSMPHAEHLIPLRY